MTDNNLPTDDVELKLTQRELAIARVAARLAVEGLTNQFYQQIGKSVVSRALMWIGAIVLGFALAKGWIVFGTPR